jgi:3-hydroxyisobutyrate dehydrogenase-like beta-hydroxyacid dehydrogenase
MIVPSALRNSHQAQGTALPITAAVHERFAKAKADGLAALNITAIARRNVE